MDDHVSTRHVSTRTPASDAFLREPGLPPPGLRPRKRLRRVFGLLALLVLLAAAALTWRHYAPAPSSGSAAASAPAGRGGQGAAPPQTVGAATAATGDVRVMLNALGTVTPLASITVKTQIAGQLQSVNFSEGQMVRKGDFLAQIDPRPYEAALEQYQGQLARDQALLKQAQADLARYQTLLKQDSIARQQAEDQVYLVQQYEAAIRSDQAQIDTQKLNVAYCRITAPVDGRVGLRQVDPGNYVQPSDANGLFVITQVQPISVIFPLPEDNLPDVLPRWRDGQKLQVAAYDRANVRKLATGTLANSDNQVDTTTGTWKLRADFDNADEALFPNQFVNIRLLLQTLHGVTTVPVTAVQHGAPGTYVYLVGDGDTVSVRPVKVGTTDGDRVQILDGLVPGDRVVTDGTDRLREGARVTVAQAEPTDGTATPAAEHRHKQKPAEAKTP